MSTIDSSVLAPVSRFGLLLTADNVKTINLLHSTAKLDQKNSVLFDCSLSYGDKITLTSQLTLDNVFEVAAKQIKENTNNTDNANTDNIYIHIPFTVNTPFFRPPIQLKIHSGLQITTKQIVYSQPDAGDLFFMYSTVYNLKRFDLYYTLISMNMINEKSSDKITNVWMALVYDSPTTQKIHDKVFDSEEDAHYKMARFIRQHTATKEKQAHSKNKCRPLTVYPLGLHLYGIDVDEKEHENIKQFQKLEWSTNVIRKNKTVKTCQVQLYNNQHLVSSLEHILTLMKAKHIMRGYQEIAITTQENTSMLSQIIYINPHDLLQSKKSTSVFIYPLNGSSVNEGTPCSHRGYICDVSKNTSPILEWVLAPTDNNSIKLYTVEFE